MLKKINGKRTAFILGMACAAFLMTACGDEIPEMSEEQSTLVTEYAAGLLMKYDRTSPSRLLPEGQATLASIPNIKAGNTSQGGETENADETSEPVSEAEVGGTPIADENEESEVAVSSEEVTMVDPATESQGMSSGGFADFITEPGINIEYSGDYEAVDSYVEPGNAYFSMDASSGKKLLVIHFTLTNTSDSDIEVNMNNYSLRYRVSVNGGKNTNVLTTMLSNDILSFDGMVTAGGSQDLAAIAEISEADAENISSLVFTIKGKSDSESITLK